MTPKPLFKLAAGFAILAALCGVSEGVFFAGVDDTGALRESLFLPLAFIFAAMAITALVFAILRIFLK